MGKKQIYFIGSRPTAKMGVTLTKRVDEMHSAIMLDSVGASKVKASVKDEIGDVTKLARIFKGGDLDHYILARKYLGALYILFRRQSIKLGIFVGINAGSKEGAQKLSNFMTRRNGYKSVDFDFKSFDIRHLSRVIVLMFRAWSSWAKRFCDASEEDAEFIERYGETVAFAFCNFDGSWLLFIGSLCSGTFMTEYLNSFLSLAYQFYIYVIVTGDWNFLDKVMVGIYGDDGGCQVPDDIAEVYNPTVIAKHMLSCFNQEITPSSKGGDFVWVDNYSLTFLKRELEWDEFLLGYRAKLQMTSIVKSLTWWRQSDVPDSMIAADVLLSANTELWLHGKEIFEEWRPRLLEAWDAEVSPVIKDRMKLPTFEDLVERWEGDGLATIDL